MIIRHSQMAVFGDMAHAQFAAQMADHVREFAPELATVAKPEGVREFVHEAIDAARAQGFRNRECVRLFIEIGLVLGHRFTTDPQYPWIQEVLADEGLVGEDTRADMLWRYVSDYLDTVVGPERAYVFNALHRLEEMLGPPQDATLLRGGEWILDVSRHCYPEKYEYVGQPQLEALLAEAAEAAAGTGLVPGTGPALIGLLMFCFGHGSLNDPLYPWIKQTLADANPQARLERLYVKTRAYLRSVSANAPRH